MNKVYEVRIGRAHRGGWVELYRDCVTTNVGSAPDFSTGLESALNMLRQQGERPISVQTVERLDGFEKYFVVTEPLNSSKTDADEKGSVPQADGADDVISTLLCLTAPGPD